MAFWKQLVLTAVLIGGAGVVWQEFDVLRALANLDDGRVDARNDDDPQKAPVVVASVSVAKDDIVFKAVGTGRALRSVELKTESAGKVVEMALAPGKRFNKGDLLLKLDDTEQRLALSLAETRLADAVRKQERYTRLQNSGATALAQLDEVRTASKIATIELERAQQALEDRILRAPFAGVAGLADVEAGAWVDSDTTITSFDDRSVILVAFDLPETLISRLVPGSEVTATTPSFDGQVLRGTIADIDSRITESSRTMKIRAAFPNSDDMLRPGASFNIQLVLPGQTFPMVPELALQFARSSVHVWKVTEQLAEKIEVKLIRRRQGGVLVDGPLAEGDNVVVEGTQRLTPGKPLQIVNQTVGEVK
ncbi:MAG: efflux RND transporter periplasmic adaptor subunit [Rhizobiaceae bacterium]